ncbi:MAG: hypothetical protein U9R25_08830 [Chloroflexota bacterium]|nr:hypothetical protein [Chloroflexota bacterium]
MASLVPPSGETIQASPDSSAATSSGAPWLRLLLQALPWLMLLILTLLNLAYIKRLGLVDDAYITYRVARNLASGHGFVFNPGEAVLSITTPGYALVLAALSFLSQDFVALGLILSGVGVFLAGACLIDLSRVDRYPKLGDRWGLTGRTALSALGALIAVSLTLTFPPLTSALGMETPLYVAAILAAFAAYRRALQQDRRGTGDSWLLVTAVAAALAFLFRPDGILVGLSIGLHWIATRRRVPWRALAVGLILTVPWVIFSWLYYGSPIPNTLAAKTTQGLGGGVPRWGARLLDMASLWLDIQSLAAIAALLGLATALWWRREDRLPLLLWTLLYIVAHTWLDVRSYFWYYVPLASVPALLAADGVVALIAWSGQRLGRSRWATATVWVGALVLLALVLRPIPLAMRYLIRGPGPDLRVREHVYRQTGEALRAMCNEAGGGPLVGMAEIGLMGYISDCRIADFSGLMQPDIAHLEIAPYNKMVWSIQRYAPDLIVLAADDDAVPYNLVEAPWFRQRYEPTAILKEDEFRAFVFQRGLGPSQARETREAVWWKTGDQPTVFSQQLIFEPGSDPEASLHAFLPPDSALDVLVNGQLVSQLQGELADWQDIPLQLTPDESGLVLLELQGTAGEQPATVAWIISNALPAVHYFVPMADASTRPRPTVRLDPGVAERVRLAPSGEGPLAIELLHRDWPGVELAVSVDGELVDVVGGSDGWQTVQVPLSNDARSGVEIELLSQGEHFARPAYLALVPWTDQVASP